MVIKVLLTMHYFVFLCHLANKCLPIQTLNLVVKKVGFHEVQQLY